ncbi:uncharacterized protein LOC110980120 [Acanthaster planci]|uniref:Uncharacterized protein LOC110980120 n=1 Tax=Acanthaster planci TaxID=133434 RepID=A0A8B7YID7_ACAPL|nr:uncharacterized protein LOC110980120 [Acanthaster planci]XP_022092166.1 uncharacterized protein LOC110980120 [Acanthaster planci]XP_022092167.1 uncharacterized protein LOC110980120 [Acanthaster planci]
MLPSASSGSSNPQQRASETKASDTMHSPSPPTTTESDDGAAARTHLTRHRLRPWLENLIDEGSVKGLEWIDKDKKLFKIPWKHAGKQDYNQEEDSKIFKLWSLNTGKYKPGIHVPEPAVWKTRLRTALNKLPDIDEVHEKTQLDIPEPYRVYRFLPKKPSNNSVKNRMPNSSTYGPADHHRAISGYPSRYTPYEMDPRSSYYTGSPYGQTLQSSCHQAAGFWYPDTGRTDVAAGYNYPNYSCYSTTGGATDLDIISDVITEDIGGNHGHHQSSHHYPPSSGHVYEQEGALAMEQSRITKLDSVGVVSEALVNNNDPRHVNYHDLVPMTTVTSSGYTTCASTKANPPPSYESSLANSQTFTTTSAVTMATESVTMDTTDVSNPHPQSQQPHEFSPQPKRMRSCSEPTLPAEHVMSIQISYRSTDAGYRCVDNPNGCVLYFNQPWEEGLQRGMEAIHLPDIGSVPAHPDMTENQMRLTSQVLGCFERGVSLECRHGNIYVTRRCRSVVFWCSPNANEKPTKLERDIEVKVFDLDQFHDQLRRYFLGEDAPPMLPKIYFTVAQKWSSLDMPLHACLISIVVTPLRASEELRTINPEVHSLPGSIHSGLLQISGAETDCASPLGNSWNDMSHSCRRMSAMV